MVVDGFRWFKVVPCFSNYVFAEGIALDLPTCMQCSSEKLITNTWLTLELDPAQHTKERW